MAIKTVETQMREHDASAVAADLNTALQQVNKDVLKELVTIKKQFVKFGGSTYKEFFFTMMFAAEGKTPIWLGGSDMPESVGGSVQGASNDTSLDDLNAQIEMALARLNAKKVEVEPEDDGEYDDAGGSNVVEEVAA